MPTTFPFPTYQSGVVREAAVDEILSPPNSMELAINVNFDRIGAIQRRQGVTLLGAQIAGGTPVLGMGVYRNNANSTYAALANVGTSVYAYAGASWSAVRTSLTSGAKARFTSLVDYVFMVNGHSNEVVKSWNGSGSFGTTNVASLPKGDFIENYRNRIWVADNSNDKVYYSDVVTTSNTITGGTEFIQVSPADGEKITGLKRHPRALLVFKQNHIYRIFSINSADPDPSILRGTYSQESIVEAKDGIYYHHPTGFYKFNFDGDQEEISRPIIDIIQAIPRASYDNIAGWVDEDHIYWAIGDITLSGITISNVVCRRTISTKVWTLYSYPKQFRSSILYDNGTDLFQLVGDSDGNVLKYNVGNTDNGTPIFYDAQTHWSYLTEVKSKTKDITKLGVLHENANGSNIAYQTDADDQQDTTNAWSQAGVIQKDLYDTLSMKGEGFMRVKLRIFGNSTGTPFIFRGFEGIDLTGADSA